MAGAANPEIPIAPPAPPLEVTDPDLAYDLAASASEATARQALVAQAPGGPVFSEHAPTQQDKDAPANNFDDDTQRAIAESMQGNAAK
jgi:hypothetical protein